MKIKQGFILRKIPGMNIVMPTGKNVKDYKNGILLNDTAAFIFEMLQKEESAEAIAEMMTEKYEIDYETARKAVLRTMSEFEKAGLIE